MRGSAIYGLYRVYVGDVLGECKRNWKLAPAWEFSKTSGPYSKRYSTLGSMQGPPVYGTPPGIP